MCNTCGCQGTGVQIEKRNTHHHHGGHDHHHHHGTDSEDGHSHHHNHVHLNTDPRIISLEIDLLAKNDEIAARNRQLFASTGTLAVNLMSSPGAGKTTLLVRTLERLGGSIPVAVIEGDQATTTDAERIRASGAPAVQINTGKGCHLDAEMIEQAIPELPTEAGGVLFIENVGNLVCPAGFDLGESKKVVIASVTEGEDKPLKYPAMFAACDLMLVSKCDLLAALDFDIEQLEENARRINPDLETLRTSSQTGDGIDTWLQWLTDAHAQAEEAA